LPVLVLVLGGRFPGVRARGFEFSSGAVGRHAGLEFLRRGHPRIAIIRPTMAFAGDAQCGEGLREAVRQHASGAEVVDGEQERILAGIRKVMERLLARAHPPTAFFVPRPNFVWPVIGCLRLAGRAISGDAAVMLPRMMIRDSPPAHLKAVSAGRHL
jgi:DNA-binding LacI/PurR family transcriptional regulator